LDELTLVYVALGLGLLATVVPLSIVLAQRLARPLRELEQIASSVVASGSFDHRFEGGGYTEVERLGNTFNKMLQSLGTAHTQLQRLAHHDVLTGLANRALFQSQLRADLLDAQRAEGLLGVLLLDIDNFKDINDTLGHPVGDELLKQVAARLSKLVRTTDTVARLGGDEFALIGTHFHEPNDVATLGQKILTSTAKPFGIFEHDIFVSVSIGIAIFPTDGDDPDKLLSNADLALYKAKNGGKGNFQFYDPALNTAAQKRKQTEASIRGALEQSAFCLHYQPRVDLDSGRLVGVEVLVRWQSEDGLVFPQEFIAIAEESRLIVPLGEWIVREACVQKLAWEQAGLPAFAIAINLSAVQLRHDEYVRRLMQVIDDTGVDPNGLEIEITESALMEHVDTIACRLRGFRDLGVRLAIDDIGTGYSSLANLKRLSVDALKIDKSFVRDIEIDADDAAITKAIIQLGSSLDLTVVAEGVETPGQAEFLRRQGCRQAQGFLYSAALDAPSLAAWIADRKTPVGLPQATKAGAGV
jgi:diguanylate cyclase (GGDEF)-like protein